MNYLLLALIATISLTFTLSFQSDIVYGTTHMFTPRYGYRSNSPSNVLTRIDKVSQGHCASACLMHPGCACADYDTENGTCIIASTADGVLPLQAAAGWNYMIREVNDITHIDCDSISTYSKVSGIYLIKTKKYKVLMEVYCDLKSDGGGWTVLQRRMDGSVNFSVDWATYKKGFGNLLGEFWIGNDNIYHLTSTQGKYMLRVDLKDFNGKKTYAIYDGFNIAREALNYRANAYKYREGTAGDSFNYHHRMLFTTFDRDNDMDKDGNCAASKAGAGWWYKKCDHANLNKKYLADPVNNTGSQKNIEWLSLEGSQFYIKRTSMKIRPLE